MRVEISTDAHEDLANGHAFYERQYSGLGGYFADTLYSEIESLQIYAGIHPIRNGFYRMLAHRFPYSIFYQIEGDVARVYAVLDSRMNPIRIRRMLHDR